MTSSLSAVKRNLDQVRALNAYAASKDQTFEAKDGGDVAKKVPGMVVMHGLLGAMAFALSDDNKKGHRAVFEAVLRHLKDPAINDATAQKATDVETWFEELAKVDSMQLRVTTAEVLAYLTFFRRFAKNDKEGGNGE